MTEVSAPGTHAELQLGPASVASHLPASLPNGASIADAILPDDPSSTIKCICDYNEDDGNTVLCEICDTWQHIECYYPALDVPEVHECRDCRPRALDIKAAKARHASLRDLHLAEAKRVKRPKSASHRKKTKDSVQLNGWPVTADREDGVEQRSGSPREQPPPTKRAKTSHKHSASVASLNQAAAAVNTHARRKNGTILSGQSPVKSPPELPNAWDYFSPEFMQLHRKAPYQHADSNFMTTIGVTNDLQAWVQDPDELAKVTNGETPTKVFSRIDGTFEALEEMSPGTTLHSEEDQAYKTIDGVHPVFQRLTVNSATPSGAYIGEIRGHISRREEYTRDPANRWQNLRHPEPFVFFAPSLPIVIDARDEGTDMRYIRRSCQPNTKMRIVIDKAKDYHFCLVSERDLEEGEEITLKWDMDQDVHALIQKLHENGSLRNQGFRGDHEQYICNWVSGVLANFGGCACSTNGPCPLSRFDRRGDRQALDAAGNALKLPKGRKGKKGTHPSPLSTGRAVNSRASSETANAKAEPYDDGADSRSVSGSSRSKPTSRDNTPGGNTADEALSAREKRKIEQLERRFEIIDHDDTPARKKKRNSAGSALNTPGIGTSVSHNMQHGFPHGQLTNAQRQLGLGLIDSQDPSPTFASHPKNSKNLGNEGMNGGNALHRASNGGSSAPVKMYVDCGTQTDTGAQNVYNTELAPCKKRRISYSQRILARTRDEKPKPMKVLPRQAFSAPQPVATTTAATATSPSPPAPVATMLPPPRPSPTFSQTSEPVSALAVTEKADEDAVMADAEADAAIVVTAINSSASPTQPSIDEVAEPTPTEPSEPIQPPPPPWPTKDASPSPAPQPQLVTAIVSATEPTTTTTDTADAKSPNAVAPTPSTTRPRNLHVTLPPIPNLSPPTPTTPSMSATPGSVTGSSIAQSPLSVTTSAPQHAPAPPLLSPAATAPSPMAQQKKKLSLSDYMGRRKAAAKEAAKDVGEHGRAMGLSAVAEGDGKDEAEEKRMEGSAVEDGDGVSAVQIRDEVSVAATDAGGEQQDEEDEDKSGGLQVEAVVDVHVDDAAAAAAAGHDAALATSASVAVTAAGVDADVPAVATSS